MKRHCGVIAGILTVRWMTCGWAFYAKRYMANAGEACEWLKQLNERLEAGPY
jgi:hypothetical protein